MLGALSCNEGEQRDHNQHHRLCTDDVDFFSDLSQISFVADIFMTQRLELNSIAAVEASADDDAVPRIVLSPRQRRQVGKKIDFQVFFV